MLLSRANQTGKTGIGSLIIVSCSFCVLRPKCTFPLNMKFLWLTKKRREADTWEKKNSCHLKICHSDLTFHVHELGALEQKFDVQRRYWTMPTQEDNSWWHRLFRICAKWAKGIRCYKLSFCFVLKSQTWTTHRTSCVTCAEFFLIVKGISYVQEELHCWGLFKFPQKMKACLNS